MSYIHLFTTSIYTERYITVYYEIEYCIRDVSRRNMSVNQSANGGKQRTASYPVKNQMVPEYQEDTHSKGEELMIEVLRKNNDQTIFWIMREQSNFQSKRSSLTGIQGIRFVSHFWPLVPVTPADLSKE